MEIEENMFEAPHQEEVDFTSAILPGDGDYEKYFKLQDAAFSLLLKCVKTRISSDTFEVLLMEDMLHRLRATMATLRMKYAFSDPSSPRGSMHVDLNESGYPNHYDVTALDVDMVDKDSILASLPSSKSLKEAILKHLLEEREEPRVLLETLAKRTYLETLDKGKLFFPFITGQLTRWNRKDDLDTRSYIVGWGCYDPTLNIPFVYSMYFKQDKDDQPYEEFGDNFSKLIKVLRFESYHSPDKLNLMATSIDQALEPIHPKVIKRVRIGPLYTPLLINQRPENARSDVEITFLDLFERAGCPDGFALLFNEEIVSSISQSTERTLFKKIQREVFYVPPMDDGAAEVGSSRVHRHILMPHSAYQVIRPEDVQHLPRYNERIRFSYDNEENIHEIG